MGGMGENLLKWKGYSDAWNTWESKEKRPKLEIKSYKCHACEYATNDNGKLSRHVEEVHDKNEEDDNLEDGEDVPIESLLQDLQDIVPRGLLDQPEVQNMVKDTLGAEPGKETKPKAGKPMYLLTKHPRA